MLSGKAYDLHNARMSDLYVLNRPLVEVARRTMLTVIASVEVVAFFFDLAVTSNFGSAWTLDVVVAVRRSNEATPRPRPAAARDTRCLFNVGSGTAAHCDAGPSAGRYDNHRTRRRRRAHGNLYWSNSRPW